MELGPSEEVNTKPDRGGKMEPPVRVREARKRGSFKALDILDRGSNLPYVHYDNNNKV